MDRNEAIDIVKKNWSYDKHQLYEALETLIPELKESENDRIRNQILDCFRTMKQQGCFPSKHKEQYDSWIAWLEKQGSQNLANSEKTFKIGDWIIKNDGKDCFSDGSYVLQITNVDDNKYKLSNNCYLIEPFSDTYRLWTIQDAKDGDVLVGNYDNCKKPWIGIFKCISKDRPTTQFDSYCFINSSHHTFITPLSNGFYNPCKGHTIRYALPATQEQRDVLFQKMNEAGYEWDAEKKELRKIEWKSAWSEEDEMMLEGAIDKISDLGTGEMVKDWLKSLKYRVQPKVKLTQLDKNILEAAIAFVAQNNHFNCWRGVDKHTVLSALHSLRPQKQWRPSDEQMEAVKSAAIDVAKFSSRSEQLRLENETYYKALVSLYNDLEKLREE